MSKFIVGFCVIHFAESFAERFVIFGLVFDTVTDSVQKVNEES